MAELDTQEREDVLDKLIEETGKNLTPEHLDYLRDFVYRLYAMDTRSDLLGGNRNDLVGATFSFWKFIGLHDPDHPLIEVLNPDYPHHGWHSTHTVVRVLHRDMPFLVDSIRMKLNERGSRIHLIRNGVMTAFRDQQFQLVSQYNDQAKEYREAFLYMEVDRLETESELEQLRLEIFDVLDDVVRVTQDFRPMQARLESLSDTLRGNDGKEVRAFLKWLLDDNFTFFGYEELQLVERDKDSYQVVRPADSLLGLLRQQPRQNANSGFALGLDKKFFELDEPVYFSKVAVRSRVHRPAYPDLIAIRQTDQDGRVIGEIRVIGLYTSPVYRSSPLSIPYIRDKVRSIMQRAGLDALSHHGKDLQQIIDIFPRDELFQMEQDQLFDTVMAILRIQERKQIRVFMRQNSSGSLYSVLVFVPREVYSTDFRIRIETVLCKKLQAEDSEFTTYFSESVLARVQFTFRLKERVDVNIDSINEEVVLAAATWKDDFRDAMLESAGEVRGNHLFALYAGGFSAGYRETFSPHSAVVDVELFESIHSSSPLAMGFYQSLEDNPGHVHFKLYHYDEPLPLADQIPIIENLGLRVLGEYPYMVRMQTGEKIWIHDFLLSYSDYHAVNIQKTAPVFKRAFEKIWFGFSENDRFNRLVLMAGMGWRQVSVLRMYSRYLKQLQTGFSQGYIAETLCNNIDIARLLLGLFETRFCPSMNLSRTQRLARQQEIQKAILEKLEDVSVLSEDKIIRRMMSTMVATQRTNFYQLDAQKQPKSYISIKLAAREIEDIPKPVPMYEIFVYSPAVEGVHLRGGKVARGGLRWSDRIEDFRTEVLGLVKAQQVKNALIVPVGAKGGFVPKHLPVGGDREAIQSEGIACYKTFIRALLDVTDNLVDGKVSHPENVIFYDDDDYYLVVAADKGTATFSDIANTIAGEYGFWLGDAFASGGSAGYDHKKMGITARGAWVSVQRHFREQDINVQKDTVSVLGIGDMSGDVFGNGVLLSESIELVAAFNHQHIFIDPYPDAASSYAERRRLFDLPRSSWSDYDQSLISEGGGIFSRQAKSVPIFSKMKTRFGINATRLTPNELIKTLLRSPVDLIWNGGIGTYIKAVFETHAEVGDKANDPVRVNGCEVQAKVVGEGGNLGLSQQGRVEFALKGGALNTDFIDNAGGVDCSDHEVNIKILLNDVVANGDMTIKQRNALLEVMTNEVADLVLLNNYRQSQTITLAESEAHYKMEEYRRFMEFLEEKNLLDRAIEFLPDNEALDQRIAAGQGLTRPELSLLISYSKSALKEALLISDIIGEDYLVRELSTAFPQTLVEQFGPELCNHRLRKEITATQVANHLIDMMGITYIHRMKQTTGADTASIALACMISRDVFGIPHYWKIVESLDYQVPSAVQKDIMVSLVKLVRRASRWFVRMQEQALAPADCVSHYGPEVQDFMSCFSEYLGKEEKKALMDKMQAMEKYGVHSDLALMVAGHRYLVSALPIVQAADQTGQPLRRVVEVYFALGEALELGWYTGELAGLSALNHWQSLATDSIRDELSWQQRVLTVVLLQIAEENQSVEMLLQTWMQKQQNHIIRWKEMLSEIRSANKPELAMFTVANKELMDLAQASMHIAEA
ncbi:NAD-specific glutamate dehydrogenase [invertebrate metagenome]|uniref:NAD-specific glutamate dehydrogenase n=1 Tax=invertebrate metagenome TaxID=1711999 RepID=A0A2H9T7B3_9ZZZZ